MEDIEEALNILLYMKKASFSISEDLIFQIHSDQIEIAKPFYLKYNIQPYNTFDSFYRRFELSDFGKRTIVIVQGDNMDIVVFNNTETPASYLFQSGKQDLRASNYYYLKKIKDIFLPKIVGYMDSVHKKYILLSPECGKFEIPEGNLFEVAYKIEKSLESTYKAVVDVISYQKGWESIIKNRIIRSLEVIGESEDRFYWLIYNLEQLIAITIRDYDVFLASHRHETILQQYEREKDAFAEKIRTVLGKISTNLLSIPITFSAALFGFREISEEC